MGERIGETLARLRRERGYSQKELALLLEKWGMQISNQAVSKWEKGVTQPSASQFLALCRALEVRDVMGTFTEWKYGGMSRLNQAGREKAEDYIKLLVASGLYAREGEKKQSGELRALPLYQLAASAGTGQFLDSSSYDMVEVGEEVPMSANFGVRLAGDSMEPRFVSGQIVWVRQQQSLSDGEIGVFLYNGNAYCKKLSDTRRGVRLVSLNEKYPPIEVRDGDELRVFGKVVG